MTELTRREMHRSVPESPIPSIPKLLRALVDPLIDPTVNAAKLPNEAYNVLHVTLHLKRDPGVLGWGVLVPISVLLMIALLIIWQVQRRLLPRPLPLLSFPSFLVASPSPSLLHCPLLSMLVPSPPLHTIAMIN